MFFIPYNLSVVSDKERGHLARLCNQDDGTPKIYSTYIMPTRQYSVAQSYIIGMLVGNRRKND